MKVGIMIPLFKKGDRNYKDNCRGVCLLAMCSRVLERVIAKRLVRCAEHLGLLDERLDYKFYFYKRSNHEESFSTVKINHNNLVK